jgi:LysM repeat protein
VGNKVYYTLDVKRLTGEFVYRQPKAPTQATLRPGQPSSTPNPLITLAGPMVTATTHKDGSVVHIVRYGQTLVQIAKAYGVTINDLFAANGSLDPTSAAIYAGQALVIHLPYTVTPTPTITLTPRPPTRTPLPTRTATPYRSPTPTITLTATPFIVIPSMQDVGLDPQKVGYGVILVSLGGLALVLIKGFLKAKH